MSVPAPRPRPGDDRVGSLRHLHALMRDLGSDLDLGRTLRAVCQGVVDGLGFDVAVLNLVRPEGDLEVVAWGGEPAAGAALMGTRASRAEWDGLLAACDPLGDLLVDYELRVPVEHAVRQWVSSVPAARGPGAWHPMDQMLAPLRTARSGLLGVLSVDLPRDGMRPDAARCELLEVYAAQAAIALENAQLHTALLTQHEARAEALGRLVALVRSTPTAIVELDERGDVRLWNPAAEAVFGWSAAEVVGRRNPLVEAEDYDARLAALEERPLVRVPVQRTRRDGAVVEVEMSASVLRDDQGRAYGYLGVYDDVTDRRRLEAQLRVGAETDPLTGLANRALFTERLAAAAADDVPTTLLLLDLDGFKQVNDTSGHAAGDRVLVEVAARIAGACREGDLVARLGGDEFVVLLGVGAPEPGGPGTPADPSADRSGLPDPDDGLPARLVQVLGEPVQVDDRAVQLGASIGVARLDGRGSGDDLLRDADVAMYAAKAAGKDGYRVFEAAMRAELLERTALVADLRRALSRGEELFLRWHPVVRLQDTAVLGLEALVRWQHPTRGELAPGAFIALAEESGLVVELGAQVLEQACRSLRRWNDAGHGATRVSVNVSPRQVQAGDQLVATVRDVLRSTGVNPRSLVLELTEEVLLDDVDRAVDVLHRLRALGVRLAVDDFGVGYSSLTYLKRLPIDVVKLDRSLLAGVSTDPAALALFDAVLQLVRRLGLSPVAEGVETIEQWQLLRRLGCENAQGFLLSLPLREREVPRLLRVGHPSGGLRPAT